LNFERLLVLMVSEKVGLARFVQGVEIEELTR